jgi:cytochrome c-type biogenesis protein CcsB
MAINTGLAQLSEALVTGATGTYMLAVVAYTGEYAFGRRGRVAATSPAVEPNVLVASGGATTGGVMADAYGAVAEGAYGAVAEGAYGAVAEGAYGAGAEGAYGAGVAQRGRHSGDRWGRWAVALTIVAAVLHLTAVTIRGVAVDRVPWGNMYEFTLVVGLIAVLSWLAVLIKSPGIRYLGLFVMMPVLLVMFLAGTLYTKASKLVPALQSYWLAIHVSSIAVAEGILMTSAAITGMYLIRSRYEKAGSSGRVARFGARLPASATLDKAAYRTVAFAFPIYTAGVIFGAIWAEAAWGRYWGWDPKETWAFIAWVIYAMYLHARATAGWKGNRAGYINLLGFSAMTFNFFVVNIVISGLHSYAGLS